MGLSCDSCLSKCIVSYADGLRKSVAAVADPIFCARYDENEGSMKRPLRIHSRGLLAEVIDRIRGHDQMLIRAGDELPLVVASYPRGRLAFATSLQKHFPIQE